VCCNVLQCAAAFNRVGAVCCREVIGAYENVLAHMSMIHVSHLLNDESQ